MRPAIRSLRTLGRAALLLGSVALAALVTHVTWSAALAAAYHTFYDHRMFNVRKLAPVYDFVPFAADFLRSKHQPGKLLIILAGASLTFGPGLSDRIIFSRQIARRFPEATVVNLAVIGAEGHAVATAVACAIRLANVTPDWVILELPVINDAVHISRMRGQNVPTQGAAHAFVCPESPPPSMVSYFLTRPKGITWLPIIHDDARTMFTGGGQAPLALNPDYVIGPEAYNRIAPDLRWLRNETLQELRKVTKHLAAYPGPISVNGIVRMGIDRANIEHQIADAVAGCRTIPGVICLDPRKFAEEDSVFWDPSHLSTAGHRAFGDWVVDQLQQRGQAERGSLTSQLPAESRLQDSGRGKLSQD